MAGNNLSSAFARSYDSFAGCDIRAVFGTKIIASLQGISWSVTREKAPIYTMGSPDPRSFARNKRGIGGSMVFIEFDKAALLEEFKEQKFWEDIDALRPDGVRGTLGPIGQGSQNSPANTVFEQESAVGDVLNPTSDQVASSPWFLDQIPPFDITLVAHSEYGSSAAMRIYGAEILNEGSGTSIDDVVMEKQCTYVCRTYSPWQSMGWRDANAVAFGGAT